MSYCKLKYLPLCIVSKTMTSWWIRRGLGHHASHACINFDSRIRTKAQLLVLGAFSFAARPAVNHCPKILLYISPIS